MARITIPNYDHTQEATIFATILAGCAMQKAKPDDAFKRALVLFKLWEDNQGKAVTI
tara:strand:- start:6212 stop:6382 length:171 start_codon:yes stop_codon:yes gene_type:complete